MLLTRMLRRASSIASARAAAATALGSLRRVSAADPTDLKAIQAEIEKRHDESVRRIQDWVKQPTIAAENKGINEGTDLMMRLLRDAGLTAGIIA